MCCGAWVCPQVCFGAKSCFGLAAWLPECTTTCFFTPSSTPIGAQHSSTSQLPLKLPASIVPFMPRLCAVHSMSGVAAHAHTCAHTNVYTHTRPRPMYMHNYCTTVHGATHAYAFACTHVCAHPQASTEALTHASLEFTTMCTLPGSTAGV